MAISINHSIAAVLLLLNTYIFHLSWGNPAPAAKGVPAEGAAFVHLISLIRNQDFLLGLANGSLHLIDAIYPSTQCRAAEPGLLFWSLLVSSIASGLACFHFTSFPGARFPLTAREPGTHEMGLGKINGWIRSFGYLATAKLTWFLTQSGLLTSACKVVLVFSLIKALFVYFVIRRRIAVENEALKRAPKKQI
ncbi:hypothetical protein BJ508DRAFT_321745 [Ascobolus immersus RN42]|uniref:Uncharacterized protein n=1 Tax=Ascobolus immersus RN42 TaxID=1160509 RepID=A0A3N4IKF1_ASCIM|nr:hypothetical protein BJ508DRAFT_321745 [Ascobolus immersus RN42]